MNRKILFATTNPHKRERFQAYFEPLGLNVVGPTGEQNVIEDGKTPEENAIKKAMAGYLASGLPSFGVDYWLKIDGLSENMQPGPFVRRIFTGKNRQRVEANDDEMIKYYATLIEKLGGQVKGVWTSAIALVINPDKKFVESISRGTLFTSRVSEKQTPFEPLNSMQIDPKSGKYFTEMTKEELQKFASEREKGYIDFMKKHLKEILNPTET